MAAGEYRPGDRQDFDRLYRTAYARIKLTLRGMLRDEAAAEDCAQDAFVRAFRAWPTWKPEAPAEAWVHRIAINVAISHRRRERVRNVVEVFRRSDGDEPDDAGRLDLLHALRRLRPRQAALVVLRHHHGYSNREIAVALGIPESTVSSQLGAAKRELAALPGERVAVRLEGEVR
ncbi:MAG: RNA polymerase sigma factor [Candidatus Dormibacteria bacterium]